MVGGKRTEKLIRIKAEPGTPEFDRLYWEIRSGKAHRAEVKTSFSALVEAYLVSKKYAALAPSTKVKYRKILDLIREQNGPLDVTTVSRSEVEASHQKYAATPRQADYYLQVLSILFNFAIRLEWMTHNPASGIDKFGARKELKPWPEWFQAEYRARATGNALAAYHLGSGTGQRPGDVVKMRWSDFDGEYMTVKQEKGREKDAHKDSETLTIYCPAKLRAFLASWPRKGEFIFAKNLREAVDYQSVEKQFRKVREAIAKERPEALDYSLHGLRYVAAIELAEAGCSDSEIQAVTGHKSLGVVQKYRAKASKKRLSKAAQERRERRDE